MVWKDFKSAELPVQTQVLLILLLLGGANGALYTYVISPLRQQAKASAVQVETLRIQVQKGEAVQARLPQFREEVARQRQHLNSLRQALPEEKETAEIVRKVQQLAVQSNLRIKSFTPQRTIARGFYEDWPILIAVEGSYSSLGSFLDQVSRFTRIINVENISIKGLDQPTAGRTLSATYTATTFVYLEQEAQL
ncbi:MAG: type 4a pilus biogenesis protein PilO [Acidobacteria bacterium]|nr:type 4a pilus biogenesis protein PilO [Acidobacteriota bacterium]